MSKRAMGTLLCAIAVAAFAFAAQAAGPEVKGGIELKSGVLAREHPVPFVLGVSSVVIPHTLF